jgi:hypothetical protein
MPRKVRVRLSKKPKNPAKWWSDMSPKNPGPGDRKYSPYQSHYLHIIRSLAPKLGHDPSPEQIHEYLSNNHRKISKFIDSKKTLGTRKTYFNALKVFYLANGQKMESEIFSRKSLELELEYQENRDDNTMDEDRSENFVSQKELIAMRDSLRELVKKDPHDYKLHQQYLILCLYTMIPPLRADYDTMLIQKGSKPPEDSNNYLWFNSRQRRWTVILNDDKVSRTYGRGELEIESKELNKIITESIKLYPRKYVLTLLTDPNKPMRYANFRSTLNELFERSGRLVGIDILRSSYITEAYSKNISVNQKKDLAKQMRHSVGVAETTYRKIIENRDVDEDQIKKDLIEITEKKANIPRFNPSEWMRTYRQRDNVKDKMKQSRDRYYQINRVKVLRAKIIRNANLGVTKPSNRKIKEYDLKFIGNAWI